MIHYGAPTSTHELHAFSRCLLQLGQLAREREAMPFIAEAVQAFGQLVPFASAWWGEMSLPAAGAPPQSWMHGRINLDEAFADEWNQVAGGDSFAHGTLSRPNEIVRASGFTDPNAEVNAFARRHNLYHLMCITFELPESGLMFFVCLYRGASAQSFGDSAASLFASFCAHLLQLWRFQLHDLLRLDQGSGASDFAVAHPDGRLLYVGAGLCAAIRQQAPEWSGSVLPATLIEQLPKAPAVVRLGRVTLTLSPSGEHVILALQTPAPRLALAPRERTAAMLFAAGHSYKEIAKLLALSPATVRTYLRNCYLQLGVRSKVELGTVLRMPSARLDPVRREPAPPIGAFR